MPRLGQLVAALPALLAVLWLLLWLHHLARLGIMGLVHLLGIREQLFHGAGLLILHGAAYLFGVGLTDHRRFRGGPGTDSTENGKNLEGEILPLIQTLDVALVHHLDIGGQDVFARGIHLPEPTGPREAAVEAVCRLEHQLEGVDEVVEPVLVGLKQKVKWLRIGICN